MRASVLGVFALTTIIAVSGCSGGRRAGDGVRWTEPAGELRLWVDDEEITVPLETMDIFVSDSDDNAEIFEIHGNGVLLVGEFPLDTKVGYEANLPALLGKEIELLSKGGEPGSEQGATLTLPDREPQRVWGGWLKVTEVKPREEEMPVDGILSGRIGIEIEEAGELEIIEGSFTVPVTTWG